MAVEGTWGNGSVMVAIMSNSSGTYLRENSGATHAISNVSSGTFQLDGFKGGTASALHKYSAFSILWANKEAYIRESEAFCKALVNDEPSPCSGEV